MFPKLEVGKPVDMTFLEFNHLLEDNLLLSDKEKVATLRRYFDLQNLKALWSGDRLDPWGNLEKSELEEALLTQRGFNHSNYLFDYLAQYSKNEERLKHFSSLIASYFNEEIKKSSGFLKKYLEFERGLRLLLTAFRAKKLGRDLVNEFQYEDPLDPIVAQLIAQKDALHFEPIEPFYDLYPVFEQNSDDPLALYQALCDYRFHKIEQLLGIDLFSINTVLAFTAQFIIVEKWLQLNLEKGLAQIKSLTEGIR
jgi:hypothetical protein